MLKHDLAYDLFELLTHSTLARLHARKRMKKFGEIAKSIGDGQTVSTCGVRLFIDPASVHDVDLFANLTLDKGYIYEPGVTALVKRQHPGYTFVDVGANNGYFSILAAKAVGKAGKVYAIEPTPATFNRLEKNVALNQFGNILLFNVAAGDHDGSTLLNESASEDGENSLLKIDNIKSRVHVPLMTLDRLLRNRHINLMKIDVEGYEKEVLAGCKGLLAKKQVDRIVFEYNHRLLHDNGHDYDGVFNLLVENDFVMHEILLNGRLSDKEIISHTQLTRLGAEIYAQSRTIRKNKRLINLRY